MSADVELIEMDDPSLDLDLDTPTDYEKARQAFLGSQPRCEG